MRRNQKINTYNSLEEINVRLNQKKLKRNENCSCGKKEIILTEQYSDTEKNAGEKYNNRELIERTKDKSIKNKKSFEELEQFDKVKTRILKYIFYKKRTAEEVRRKFEATYDKEILTEVIENLIDLGYINDNSYIDRAVNEYMAIKDMSIREIKNKLLSKGLKNKTIDEYFQEKYEILKEYEIKSAKNIANKKSRTMDNIEIRGFLMRKGYSSESIKEALN